MQRGGSLTASGEVWLSHSLEGQRAAQPAYGPRPQAPGCLRAGSAPAGRAPPRSLIKLNELAPARFLLRAGFGSDATRHDLSPRRCERRETDLVSRGPIFSTHRKMYLAGLRLQSSAAL